MPRTVEEAASLVAAGGCAPCEMSSARGLALDEPTAPSTTPEGPWVSWSGPVLVEGRPTGDGRLIEEGAARWDTLPMPFQWAPENLGEHQGAQVVGLIDSLSRDENGLIQAEGRFNLGGEIGREAYRHVREGLTTGVSADPDDVSLEVRVRASVMDLGEEVEELTPDEDGRVTIGRHAPDDELFVMTDLRIRSVTMVSIPAFEELRIHLTDADAPADAAEDEATDPAPGDEDSQGEFSLTAAAPAPAPRRTKGSRFPVAPPSAWFQRPDLDEATPLTVSDTGRVFGHLAMWGTCHTGYPGQCITPPSSPTGYSQFLTGGLVTAEGDTIAVGQITLGTGHAAEDLSRAGVIAHYDDTGTAVADITVGEDEFGIWFAGALRPNVTPEQVRALRAAPLSGDWRQIGAGMELFATLGVNGPGFPVPRVRALVAGGQMKTLLAAGMVPPRQVIAPGQPGALSTEDLRYLRSLIRREKAAVRRERADAVHSLASQLPVPARERVRREAQRQSIRALAATLS